MFAKLLLDKEMGDAGSVSLSGGIPPLPNDSWNMFSAKIWFVKTSTKTVKNEPLIIKSNLLV